MDDIIIKGKITEIDQDYMEIDGRPVILSEADKTTAEYYGLTQGDTVAVLVDPRALETKRIS